MARHHEDTIVWKMSKLLEQAEQVNNLMRGGWKDKAIANYLGTDASSVRRFRTEHYTEYIIN